jgi:pimeloyl-ACP methyl ester carboxylesterase
MVDVGGGLSLHIHCRGSGAPLVVMDAGFGGGGSVWELVQPDIGRFTRVCVYDRAGAGYSDTPPVPHTGRQIVRELHGLLVNAGLRGPFVFVGHSFGGLHVRLYASEYPQDVAGIVLVDASTEDQDTRFWALEPAEARAKMKAFLLDSREGVSEETFAETMANVRASNRSLGARPLVVLTAGLSEDPPPPEVSPELAARLARVWQEMQAELPRLSSNSAQIVATKSHHFIQADAPKLVVAAVREVVDVVRAPRRIDPAPLRALAESATPAAP